MPSTRDRAGPCARGTSASTIVRAPPTLTAPASHASILPSAAGQGAVSPVDVSGIAIATCQAEFEDDFDLKAMEYLDREREIGSSVVGI